MENRSFFERRHVGDIASRFTSLEMIQKTLTTGAISGLVDGLMSVGLVVMMWLYEPLLAMLAVGVMVLYGISRAVAYRLYRAANEEAIVYAARENTHFFETLRGMPSIKALVIGDRRQAAWNNYLVDHVGAELRVQKLDLVFKTINTLLFGLDRIVIIYLGARSVMSGTLSVGMLVAFLAYKDQFSSRIATLLDTLVRLTLLGLHCERVADIALAEPEEAVGPYVPLILTKGAPARACRGAALSARGISFRYGDNEPPVIADFDFDLAPGECVAIVGPSGAGKTTLLKLLGGLLPPSSGTVLLDDVPVAAIGMERYRSQIGCVLQDDRLFAGTVADNIAAFDLAADPDRILHAAKLAAMHDEIMRMPMGYQTLVGDMGSSLAGGQIQRLVLARALYRTPRILLLDEATAISTTTTSRLSTTPCGPCRSRGLSSRTVDRLSTWRTASCRSGRRRPGRRRSRERPDPLGFLQDAELRRAFRDGVEGLCRKVRVLGQNPKIGYQKFNDLQTAKISRKQLCDRAAMITRIFAAALFALLTVTTPARAATILNLDLDFGNGYQEIGSVEFFGGPGFLFGYQGCCGLNVYYNGTPLSPFTGPVGGIPPQPNSAVGLFDIGGSPVAFGLPLSNTQKFPYLTFADFSLIGTPAVSGDVSIVPLPAALPLFRSEWANAFHDTAYHPQRDKTRPAANATT